MRMIVFRKTYVFIVGFISLVLLLLAVSYVFSPITETFENSLEYQKAERQVLKKYQALQGKFGFSLPENWTTMEEAFSGGEIIYNIYFMSQDKAIHGFVQVWDIKKPLKQFLDESKKSAVGEVDFKYYRVKETTADGKKGYTLEYSRRTDEGKYIRAYEVFLEGKNGRIYRVSFFVDEENWKPQYQILFNRIIRSLEIEE